MKLLFLVLFVLILMSSCKVEKKEQIENEKVSTVENKEKEDIAKFNYEEWTKYEISGFGEIIIPPAMEVQKGKYKEIARKLRSINGYEEPQIVFQQSGLNEDKADAKESYARVIVKTTKDKAGTYERLYDLRVSKNELDEAGIEYKNMFQVEFKKKGMTIVDWYPLEIEKVNGAPAMVTKYTRKSTTNNVSNVLVKMYQFQNYDRMHIITFSYRISEKDKWEELFKNIVESIKIKEVN